MEPRPDFIGLLVGLRRAGVEFIVVGGMAAVGQGVPTTTFDLDIVPRGDQENLTRLLAFLRSVHARYRGCPAGQILEPTEADLGALGHCLLMTDHGAMDVLGRIEEGLDYTGLLPHTRQVEIRGQQVRLLGIEKIIEIKRGSAREKDRLLLSLLEETLKRQK